MNKDFFDNSEKNDLKIFNKLNEDTKMLKYIAATPYKYCVDVSGRTELTNVLIELKNRKGKTTSFPDIYIESKKAAFLYFSWVACGQIPLYINYFNNYKNDEYPEIIAIWRLDKLSKFIYHPNTETKSQGYEKTEYRERFGLYIKDAVIYKLINGKYTKVKNIGEEYE